MSELEPPRLDRLAHRVFGQREHKPDELDPLIIQSCLAYPEICTSRLTLDQLWCTTVTLVRRLAHHGVRPGDTVALICFPFHGIVPVLIEAAP